MKLIVTESNYFSKECELYYTGSSQIKSFLECETRTLAKIKGEYVEKKSQARLASSYIDAYFTGTLEMFKQEHPEMFKQDGTLYSQFKNLDDIILQAEKDELFVKYLKGEKQVIFTGEISNVPVKIKIDSFFKDKVIVDLKAIADFKPIWNDKLHCKQNFVDYYDYILQAALYQEIVRQNTGKKLPFIIAVLTKEQISERALLKIPQELLDEKLEFIKEILPHIQALKNNEIKPTECKYCDFCKTNAKTLGIYNYNDYFDMRGGC